MEQTILTSANPHQQQPSKTLRAALWLTQGLLALTFVGTGVWKFATPIRDLAAMIPWAGEVSPTLLYATAVFDLLGGLGLFLPSATRIAPRLALFAALGCAALQCSAVLFHFSRGEAANTPFNFLLIAMSLFVFQGRQTLIPIPPRRT